MAVRNFWIEAYIDGRKTVLSGGPQSKDGGMRIVIKQRSNGGIKTAYKIECYADSDGTLYTDVIKADDSLPTTHLVTER